MGRSRKGDEVVHNAPGEWGAQPAVHRALKTPAPGAGQLRSVKSFVQEVTESARACNYYSLYVFSYQVL